MWMTIAFDLDEEQMFVLAVRRKKEDCERVTETNLQKISKNCLVKMINFGSNRTTEAFFFELRSFFLLNGVEEEKTESTIRLLFSELRRKYGPCG